ncbi:MAG: ribonuclease D [Proteobacteria bacterium]|nr:ribonuclease D [Pseudomonadota bacterium]
MSEPTIHVSLNDLPAGLSFDGAVAVDTETLGLKVGRDRLCVCQVGDGKGNAWLVQFDGTDWSAPNLKKLLADKNITKIFHFGRFDIAILHHHLGVDVAPVFCTKIASKLVRTYTDRHGLKELCNELLSVNLDKQQQTSYWAAPALSEDQKKYAASDVLYLHQLRTILIERLNAVGRLHMAEAAFAYLPHRALLDEAGWEETDIFAH